MKMSNGLAPEKNVSFEIKTLLRVCTHQLKYDREMPLTRLQILLVIYQKGTEGALVRDITTSTGLNQSTVARALAHLGDKPLRGQRDALRWIESHPDHLEPRRVRVHLSARGQQVMSEVENLL